MDHAHLAADPERPGTGNTAGTGSTNRGRRQRPRRSTAGWADLLGPPAVESSRSALVARVGGVIALFSILGYVTWRIAYTIPTPGPDAAAAILLITFEAVPAIGMIFRLITLWNIDSSAPAPVQEAPGGLRVAVLIPTYDEPAEVIVPTIAAACALEPAHQTWVLDDGDRPWVREICDAYGARYVARPVHDHAKAGNLNHALALMEAEAAAGAAPIDLIATLDCDHVPLEHFLTSTLGWFADPTIALVQAPQSFYNSGAFDDDGINGEQGLFFNVMMAARNHPESGPFWCGSTAVLRTKALHEIGGVATQTIVEDMHTTLGLVKAGWRTVYHHQTLAVGLAPATAEQYLLQRKRWGLGVMQVLIKERLWSAKRWLSWRNYYEYLTGSLWWLEGAATVMLLLIPVALIVSGAQTSTAPPLLFGGVFIVSFAIRLWGAKRFYRHQLSWTDALALRILRIPIGLACVWWLLTRRTLQFEVTPKAATHERVRSQVPGILTFLMIALAGVIGYAALGLADLVPWRATPGATVASGAWLLIAAAAVAAGMRRIRAIEFSSSRRSATRFPVRTGIRVDGHVAELLDASVGGLRIRHATASLTKYQHVMVQLPGAALVPLQVIRSVAEPSSDQDLVSLSADPGDWATMRVLSLWLFHTPAGAVTDLPDGVPAAACTTPAQSQAVRSGRAASARVRSRARSAAVHA